MDAAKEDSPDIAVYRRLKETIDKTYPDGWFVASADDQIVAAAVEFRELERMLRAQGKDPRNVLVIEADVDYPDCVTIFV